MFAIEWLSISFAKCKCQLTGKFTKPHPIRINNNIEYSWYFWQSIVHILLLNISIYVANIVYCVKHTWYNLNSCMTSFLHLRIWPLKNNCCLYSPWSWRTKTKVKPSRRYWILSQLFFPRPLNVILSSWHGVR